VPKRPRKIRVEFRKNRQRRARRGDLTRQFQQDGLEDVALPTRETVQPKGEISRRRTVVVESDEEQAGGEAPVPALSVAAAWHAGRVRYTSGVLAMVEDSDGRTYTCAVSRVLRTIAIESRSTVVAGDRVHFRLVVNPVSGPDIGEPQGMIERVDARRGVLARAYRGLEQVIAANVDQALVVSALAEPGLKLNLVDRYIVAAEKGGIRPVICLNKADLVDIADFQPFFGLYSQLGYDVLVLSAQTGLGLRRLRQILSDRATVLAGQSGVGKSSLLNALEPGLKLRVAEVSRSTLHGRHITRMAELHKLSFGGWVVDTPGIRQFELWDVIPEELEGYFVEFRPYVPACHFANCTHQHEEQCAVKAAVAAGEIDADRYQRYLNIFADAAESRAAHA
jgi:ribosome biogenesis GTPase